MLIPALLSLLPLAASSWIPSLSSQHLFSNPTESSFKIPTSYESAVLGRRILNLTPLATISTTFPSSHSPASDADELERRGVSGIPIGLTEYIADCEDSGNPTLLGISLSTYMRNAAAGSNISLSVQWTPPHPPSSRIKSSLLSSKKDDRDVGYSAANLPRFALLGYLEKIPEAEVSAKELRKCFLKPHPDARFWLPGNNIHESHWVRLVVQDVYWVGGFGDRAYIGWIPVEEWMNVTRSEWEEVRLPGEKKGWKEWAVDGLGLGPWEL
jgi:hypothetical protein